MENLKLILRTQITDVDVLNNIADNTDAILIGEDNCWIEISNQGFFIPDGWLGVTTKNIAEAINELVKFKVDNNFY